MSTDSFVSDDSTDVKEKMREKFSDGKMGVTKPVGYRVPSCLLKKFAEICDREGLDHQAQIRMMIGNWIESRSGDKEKVSRGSNQWLKKGVPHPPPKGLERHNP